MEYNPLTRGIHYTIQWTKRGVRATPHFAKSSEMKSLVEHH
jgi:hypothetical protein